jgi:hypothetical protein
VVICMLCGLAGHVKYQCPDYESPQGPRRTLYLTIPEDRPRVADRPRRCCGEPTIETVEGIVLDDTPARRGKPHICKDAAAA